MSVFRKLNQEMRRGDEVENVVGTVRKQCDKWRGLWMFGRRPRAPAVRASRVEMGLSPLVPQSLSVHRVDVK